jgi:hypothetical protein
MFNSLVFLWGFLGMKFLIDYMKSDLEAIEILLEWCIKAMGCFKSLVGILMLYLCNLNKK